MKEVQEAVGINHYMKLKKIALRFYDSKNCILLQTNRKRLINVKVLSFILMAMLSLQTAVYAQPREVHILSVNDMHAEIGRFPQLVSIADSLRRLTQRCWCFLPATTGLATLQATCTPNRRVRLWN